MMMAHSCLVIFCCSILPNIDKFFNSFECLITTSLAQAVSRRATLHEMIRDYAQATSDLQRLVSILENKSADKTKESCTPGRSTGSVKELRKAQSHLSVMEEEAKKGICLDLYLIL